MGAAIDYARLMSDEGLTEAIYVRISPGDRKALRELATRLPLKEAAIARLATSRLTDRLSRLSSARLSAGAGGSSSSSVPSASSSTARRPPAPAASVKPRTSRWRTRS